MKITLVLFLGLGLGFDLLDSFRNIVGPNVVGQVEQILGVFKDASPRKLNPPRGHPVVHVNVVKKNLARTFVSVCPIQKFLGLECVCSLKYKEISIIHDKKLESQALIAADIANNDIIVAYRPTITPRNWITDIDFTMVQLDFAPKGVLVHRGFYHHHNSLKARTFAEVKKILDTPKYANFTLHITGFSLGGAIAAISLPEWQLFLKNNNYSNNLVSFSYESPRVGNEKFAQYIAGTGLTVVRYTHTNDLVPRLPPRTLGFTHVGLEYHFDNERIVQCRQDYDEDPGCSLGYKFPLLISPHLFPDGKFIPFPPYC